MPVGETNRRAFIAGLGSTAASWPVVAQAEQPAVPAIGFLGSGSPELVGGSYTCLPPRSGGNRVHRWAECGN